MAAQLVGYDRIDSSSAPALRADITMCELDGEPVLLDQGTGQVLALNAAVALSIGFLDGAVTLAELAADVADVFDVPVETATHDLVTLGRELGRMGVLQDVAALPHEHVRQPVPSSEPGRVDHQFDGSLYLPAPPDT